MEAIEGATVVPLCVFEKKQVDVHDAFGKKKKQ